MSNTIANQYFQRDNDMGLDVKNVFENATNKLCLSPQGMNSLINNIFMVHVKNETKKYLKNKTGDLTFNYDKFKKDKLETHEYQNMIKKYNFLKNFLIKNEHLEFYQALTYNDLCDLGY